MSGPKTCRAGAAAGGSHEHHDHVAYRLRRACAGALLLAGSPARAEPPKLPVPAVDQSAVAQRGYFYVGGQYTGEPGKEIMQGQIYVEVLRPGMCAGPIRSC